MNVFENDIFKNFNLYFYVEEGGIMPQRANFGDAGLDFFSPREYKIPPRGDVLIPLQLRVKFSHPNFALIFKEKSGIAVKKKLTIGACVVDSGYEGIIHAHLFNNSDEEVIIKRGDKIVQGVVVPVWIGEPIEIKEYNFSSQRGEGGFGSTGEKL